jgi:hypothetical protein
MRWRPLSLLLRALRPVLCGRYFASDQLLNKLQLVQGRKQEKVAAKKVLDLES